MTKVKGPWSSPRWARASRRAERGSTGFLPPRYSVVDINPEAAVKGNPLDEKALQLLEERWKLLGKLKEAEKGAVTSYGKEMAGYGGGPQPNSRPGQRPPPSGRRS